MAATFDFETISEASGIVTRRLTIQPDTSVVAPFYVAVQFNLGYAGEVVSIAERSLLPDSPGVSPSMNPSTVEGLAQTSELRVAAFSNVGFNATDPLLELVYSHEAGLDPTFVLSDLVIDEAALISDGVQFSADAANQGDLPATGDESDAPVTGDDSDAPVTGDESDAPVTGDESDAPVTGDESDAPVTGGESDAPATGDESDAPATEDREVVASVLGSAGPHYLYSFTNDRIGVSTDSVVAGEQIAAESILNFRMTASRFLSAQALLDSGVTGSQFSENGDAYQLTLSFQNGTQSVLSFATGTGILAGFVDTPADEVSSGDVPAGSEDNDSGGSTSADGAETGTGITDPVGYEVQAAEVESLLPAAESAFVVYRQRLGDAVALEATHRDGSVVAKIIGDADARFSGLVSNGSTELTVDLPAGANLDLLGLAGSVGETEANRYLSGLVDSAVPATNAGSTAWNGSLKQAVSKASSDLADQSFNLDVITPTRPASDVDEIVVAHAGDRNALAALNLSQVGDLVTVAGYDAIVAVGSGQIGVSGSSDASVYGDIHSQQISGGRGNDLLSGGGGSDVLTGGAGEDVFELGFGGMTVINDLAAEDTVMFDLFGVNSLDQLNARIQSVDVGESGLRVQFDTFAVELVGYSDISQIQSGLTF